jgi:hypothetical protein
VKGFELFANLMFFHARNSALLSWSGQSAEWESYKPRKVVLCSGVGELCHEKKH